MKNTVVTFKEAKQKGEKLTMLTAYDYSTAKLIDESGVNSILVGDSLGNVILGYEDTISVTMEDMIHHTRAVARGADHTLVVADMPFMSYQTSVYDAVCNAGRLMKEGRAQAVKLEGGSEFAEHIRAITNASIPVVAHLGLTPQSLNAFGGFKVQGKSEQAARKLLADAKAVEEAGAVAVVLECVPAKLAELITKQLQIPTIGIGAGAGLQCLSPSRCAWACCPPPRWPRGSVPPAGGAGKRPQRKNVGRAAAGKEREDVDGGKEGRFQSAILSPWDAEP